MTSPRPHHPEALPHGEIEEIFPDVFFVKGTVVLTRGVPFTMPFSRNMVVVRQGNELTLVNTLRLDEEGLKELDKLGQVKHAIRLAGYHGMDDPFYKERYGATVWAPENAAYFPGFERDATPYFKADKIMTKDTTLPIKDSSLILIESSELPEALLLMNRPEGKILVSGDSLQNWSKPDQYFSCLSGIMMRFMGFIKPHNVGPGWYAQCKPDKAELENLLDVKFDHVLPVHGEPCIGQAYKKYEPSIKSLK